MSRITATFLVVESVVGIIVMWWGFYVVTVRDYPFFLPSLVSPSCNSHGWANSGGNH
jgi:hypothetical protein